MSSTSGRAMNDFSQTLSVFDDEGERAQHQCPHLVFAFCADRLAEPSRRILLDGRAAEIVFGRAKSFSDDGDDDRSVGIADPRMSSKHARIVRAGGAFDLEDLGSKNGTLVNGNAVADLHRLKDGDVVELGHSFFVFREPGPTWSDDDIGPCGPRATPLRTMYGPLAERYRELGRVAATDLCMTIRGETGVGKEVVARTTHELSGRPGPFVAVNCGALPEALVESELFGAKKGAFSGADADRVGYVEAAHGGTLFLDEIGELPLAAQAKLLRALQERLVTPIGSTEAVRVDFRLMTATHQDLEARVAEGAFRGDLFARISGFDLTLPPLRERKEDLGLLIRVFVTDAGAKLEDITMGRSLARRLMLHKWPYNVRELQKGIGVALTLAEHGVLQAKHFALDEAPTATPAAAALDDEDEARRKQLVELLRRHDGNISQVAREMGKARMQIHRWLKRYGIDPKAP